MNTTTATKLPTQPVIGDPLEELIEAMEEGENSTLEQGDVSSDDDEDDITDSANNIGEEEAEEALIESLGGEDNDSDGCMD